jgi:hypothetical protein
MKNAKNKTATLFNLSMLISIFVLRFCREKRIEATNSNNANMHSRRPMSSRLRGNIKN